MTDKAILIPCLLLFSIAVLILGSRIKRQFFKDCYLLFFALLCFGFHIVTVYESFFHNAMQKDLFQGTLSINQLFPVYFCNAMMILALVTAGWWHKRGRLFNNLATFTAWGCFLGGFLAILYLPVSLSDHDLLKSTLSHFCLFITGVYLFIGGYARINVYNVIPFSFLFIILFLTAVFIEVLFKCLGKESPNAMYIRKGPDNEEALEVLVGPVFIPLFLTLIFLVGVIWEFMFRKKEDRWYKTAKDALLYIRLPLKVEERILGLAGSSDPGKHR